MNTSLMLRAGLLLGAVRTLWVAVEHLVGARSTHLEWVEPSYGLFLFVGAPLTWFFLLRDDNKSAQPQGVKEILTAGLGAGLLSGLIHVGVFALYTEILNPDYLDAFISWNAENSSNTFEIANREFRLPAFLDILLVHPILINPVTALLVHLSVRAKKWCCRFGDTPYPSQMNLNVRFGLIFWAVQCAWILGEYALGWHTTDLDVTRGAQGFFFFPAAAVMAWGLIAHKRQNAALTYLNALKMGAVVGLVVGLLSVPFHWAYTTFLNPDYAANMIESMVATNTATLEEATQQFAMPGYAFGLLIFPIVAGVMTNAILGLFMKTSWR